MIRTKSFKRRAVAVAKIWVVAFLALWIGAEWQISQAQDQAPPKELLITRGVTDAPAGTALISGDAAGGGMLLELRVVEGQKVTRGEIIAVLSNFPTFDGSVRSAESELEKAKVEHEAMISGFRKAEIVQQEIVVKSSSEENKLQALEMQRSGKPPDQQQLQLNISQHKLEKDQMKLRVMSEKLANDLAISESDILIKTAKLENAQASREEALVRSPLDGVVVQIWNRPGERINQGIAKIVDMEQLRVFADVDEMNLNRVLVGNKVELTFRGNRQSYRGTISRILPTVKRMQRIEPDGASSTDARVVQVEIKLDDPDNTPRVLGRETRVTFLQ